MASPLAAMGERSPSWTNSTRHGLPMPPVTVTPPAAWIDGRPLRAFSTRKAGARASTNPVVSPSKLNCTFPRMASWEMVWASFVLVAPSMRVENDRAPSNAGTLSAESCPGWSPTLLKVTSHGPPRFSGPLPMTAWVLRSILLTPMVTPTPMLSPLTMPPPMLKAFVSSIASTPTVPPTIRARLSMRARVSLSMRL